MGATHLVLAKGIRHASVVTTDLDKDVTERFEDFVYGIIKLVIGTS